MKPPFKRPLTSKELAELPDEEIDFSDMPETDEEFWKNAEVIHPDKSEPVTIRVKRSVLEFFKAEGKGYQTRMNAVLESYVKAKKSKVSEDA